MSVADHQHTKSWPVTKTNTPPFTLGWASRVETWCLTCWKGRPYNILSAACPIAFSSDTTYSKLLNNGGSALGGRGLAYLLMVEDKLIAALDPNGFRPLSIGKMANGAIVVSSETCAFEVVGRFQRNVWQIRINFSEGLIFCF